MVRPFCGFPMIDCYQNHCLLSSACVFITQILYICIYDCCTMIWTKLLLAGFSNRVWLVGDILGKMAKTAWELQNQHFWCKFERGGGGGGQANFLSSGGSPNICFHLLAIWWVEPFKLFVSIFCSNLNIAIIDRYWLKMSTIL